MPVIPFVSGQDTLAADFNAALDAVYSGRYQTADLSRNNTTAFLDSTDLVIPLLANAVYGIESLISYDTNTTADIQLRFTFPTGVTGIMSPWGASTAATTATNSIMQQSTSIAPSYTVSLGGAGTGSPLTARIGGTIITSSTPGNVVVGFAQAVANVSNTLLKALSKLSASRIG